jgi:hypothetical protein
MNWMTSAKKRYKGKAFQNEQRLSASAKLAGIPLTRSVATFDSSVAASRSRNTLRFSDGKPVVQCILVRRSIVFLIALLPVTMLLPVANKQTPAVRTDLNESSTRKRNREVSSTDSKGGLLDEIQLTVSCSSNNSKSAST